MRDTAAVTDAAGAAPVRGARSPRRGGRGRRELTRWAWGLAGILAVALIWEGYKLLGPADGVVIGTARVLPRTTDLAMPHVWDMIGRARRTGHALAVGAAALDGRPPRGPHDARHRGRSAGSSASSSASASRCVMQRWRLAEWGLLPWIVISQTVPLIAFAPVVKSWGSRVEIGSFEWQDWMSVALIASYLAFFPIAIGALKGLESPDLIHEELMQTLRRGLLAHALEAPVPGVRALPPAGAAARRGERRDRRRRGRGLDRPRRAASAASSSSSPAQASGDPAKAWGPIFGAIVLGLVAAGSVALLGVILKNYRRTEEAA